MPSIARSRPRLADVTAAFNCATPAQKHKAPKQPSALPETSPSALRVVDLREELKERQLPTTGRKPELIQRVREARQAYCAAPAARWRRERTSPPAASPAQQPTRTNTAELLAIEDPFKRADKLPRTPLADNECPSNHSTPRADETVAEPGASPPPAPENSNEGGVPAKIVAQVESTVVTPAPTGSRVCNVVAVLSILVALVGGALVARTDGGLAGTVEAITQTVDQLDSDGAARTVSDAFTTCSAAVKAVARATESMAVTATDTLVPYGQQLSADATGGVVALLEQCKTTVGMAAEQWEALLAGIKLQMSADARVAELEAQVAALEAELQSGRR
jgi:hypothetical protein